MVAYKDDPNLHYSLMFDALHRAEVECVMAMKDHGSFDLYPYGIAIIREEYLELEREVFQKNIDAQKVHDEACQVAATAIKMMILARLKGAQ